MECAQCELQTLWMMHFNQHYIPPMCGGLCICWHILHQEDIHIENNQCFNC